MNAAADGTALVPGDSKSDSVPGAEFYIAQIGDRIKSMRMRRGMTRKLLSENSRISERYLSQVESGQANISVALLWRIAQAMDVTPQGLLPDEDGRESLPSSLFCLLQQLDHDGLERAESLLKARLNQPGLQNRGVALVGLRGAGKSALGRKLSKRTQIPFVDLVDEVRRRSGMALEELFSLGGQKAYRRIEHEALDEVLLSKGPVIVETGGSLVTQRDTFAKLMTHFYTVWIKAAPEEHMARVVAQGDLRPMHGIDNAMEDLKRILAERESEYRSAHYVLNTSGRALNACVDELVRQTSDVLNQQHGNDSEAPLIWAK